MPRLRSLVVLISLAFVGCAGLGQMGIPVGTKRGSHASSSPHSADFGTAIDISGDASLQVLGETLTPTSVWERHRTELRENKASLPESEFRSFVNVRSAQLITDSVSESLLYQQAMNRLPEQAHAKVDELADAEIRSTVTSKYGGIERRYEKHLQSEGRTIEDVRRQLGREIVIAGYLDQQIRPKVAEPTRAELVSLYNENADDWRKPTRRSMALIDIRINEFLPSGVNEPTRTEWDQAKQNARRQADDILARLRGGTDFAELARKYSNGLHASDGGDWGFITISEVRERFQPAVEALQKLGEGEVSDVIETPESFFIVRCTKLEPGFEPTFEKTQPELVNRLFKIQFNREVALHVEQLRKQAGLTAEKLDRFHQAVVTAAMNASESTNSPS